jgi:hypothetical protein
MHKSNGLRVGFSGRASSQWCGSPGVIVLFVQIDTMARTNPNQMNKFLTGVATEI